MSLQFAVTLHQVLMVTAKPLAVRMYNKDGCAMSSTLNIRAPSSCLLYISQPNVDNCNGTPCSNPRKYLLPLAMLYLPLNKYFNTFKKSLFTIMPVVSILTQMQLLKKMPSCFDLTILIVWFSTGSQKMMGQFNSCSPTICFISHHMRFSTLLSEGKIQGTSVRAFVSPGHMGQLKHIQCMHSALFRVRLQWMDNQSCLSP